MRQDCQYLSIRNLLSTLLTGKTISNLTHFLIGATLSVVVLIFLYFQVWYGPNNTPYYGDENFYVKNAESFYRHSSLEAAFSYTGRGARLLGVDAHGPAYPLLHGGISKLIGWHLLTIPLIHLFLLGSALLCLYIRVKSELGIKLLQILLVLGCPVTLFYSMTFMPELIHISGGMMLYVLLKAYLDNKSMRNYGILLAFILVLGFFRSTWFFAYLGLIVLPGPKKEIQTVLVLVAGLVLAFGMQYLFHEQVPNAFSEAGNWIAKGQWERAIADLLFNTKRNLYFLLNYTEGWFYTFQKIWLILSLIVAFFYAKKEPLIRFGVAGLLILLVFNLVFYKNYDWVDLRMYTPWVIFLNLGLIHCINCKALPLLALNFSSFLLILPFFNQLMTYRTQPGARDIPQAVERELVDLKAPVLVHIDPAILDGYALWQLPISNHEGEPIRYILPYYEIEMASPDIWLVEKDGQLSACPKKSLCQ